MSAKSTSLLLHLVFPIGFNQNVTWNKKCYCEVLCGLLLRVKFFYIKEVSFAVYFLRAHVCNLFSLFLQKANLCLSFKLSPRADLEFSRGGGGFVQILYAAGKLKKKKQAKKGNFRHFLGNLDQKIAFFRRALFKMSIYSRQRRP